MIKISIKIALLFVLLFTWSSCEKDDVCDATTPTTPKIVVEFYDANTLALKNINLKVTNSDSNYEYVTTNSSIKIPLKTFQDTTSWNFILNGNDQDTTNDNTDVITINYTRTEEFISRACGFKTVFNLNATNPFVITTDASTWIQNHTITQPNINNENETHIKIYF